MSSKSTVLANGHRTLVSSIGDLSSKKREAELEEIISLQQAILNSANYTIIATRVDGTIITFNAAAERLLGYTASEVVGKHSPVLFHSEAEMGQRAQELSDSDGVRIDPTSFEVLVAKARRVQADEREWTYIRKDGSGFPVLLSVTAMRDAQDNITGFLGIGSDITERKQEQLALQMSASRLQLQQMVLMELAKCQAFYTGQVNAAFQKITQTAAHTLDVERVSIWLYNPDRSGICCADLYRLLSKQHSGGMELLAADYPAYFQALETDDLLVADDAFHDPRTQKFSADYLTEYSITSMLDVPIRSGGLTVGVLCLEQVGNPRCWTFDEQNFATHLAYMVSMAIESGDRLLAESALRQSEARLAAAQKVAQVGDWEFDLTTGNVTWSDEKWRIFGLEPGAFDLSYEKYLQMVHPDDIETIQTAVQKTITEGQPYSVDQRIFRPDGQMRHIFIKGEPVFNDEGSMIKLFGTVLDITERKILEQELVWRDELWNAFFSASPAGIAIWDDQLRYVQINQTLAEINGLPVSAHIGQTVAEALPELAPNIEPSMGQVLQTGEPILNQEISGITPKQPGVMRHWLWSIFSLSGQNGNPRGVGAVVIEISDRFQAKEKLRHSESRYRAIVEDQTELICRFFPDGTLTFVNEAYCRYFGLKRQELIGNSFVPFIPEQDREPVQKHIESVFALTPANPVAPTMEHRVVVDGTIRWQQWTDRAIFDDRGNMVELQAIGRDITDRKESEERFQLALEGSDLGLWDWYIATGDAYLSPQWKRMLGYAPDEITDSIHTWQRLLHPEDRPRVMETLNSYLRGEIDIYEVEFRMLTKSGDWKWILSRAKVFDRFEDGAPVRMTGTHKDISDRKAVEVMKDEFIGVVSHELRTPMTAIHASLKLLATGKLGTLSAQGNRMLDIAVNNTDRLNRMINDILDLQRMSSGRSHMEKLTCNAKDIILHAAETMQTMADRAGVALDLKTVSIHICADEDKIMQTLTNLLSNAIKFSPANSTIWVTVENKKNEVLFQVKDRGRGIPADKLESIFERFGQVDASDSRQKGGTGLGLAICRQIVEQHGGRIWVESVFGQGSSFYFTLPVNC